jgi:hypothetical protein
MWTTRPLGLRHPTVVGGWPEQLPPPLELHRLSAINRPKKSERDTTEWVGYPDPDGAPGLCAPCPNGGWGVSP